MPTKTNSTSSVSKKKDVDDDVSILYYIILVGCTLYLIGLFLPYYQLGDKSVSSINVLYLGYIYLCMMSFAEIICIVGIFTKKNYIKLITLNIVFSIVEVASENIYAMVYRSELIFSRFYGSGFIVTFLGGTIACFGVVVFFGTESFKKQLEELED